MKIEFFDLAPHTKTVTPSKPAVRISKNGFIYFNRDASNLLGKCNIAIGRGADKKLYLQKFPTSIKKRTLAIPGQKPVQFSRLGFTKKFLGSSVTSVKYNIVKIDNDTFALDYR